LPVERTRLLRLRFQ
jgi:CspA family cold shock protein